MPFLLLNGYDPGVSPDGIKRAFDEIGERGRVTSGTPRLSRRTVKDGLEFVTKPQTAAEAHALRHYLAGRHDTWPLSADTWSSKGREANAGAVATLRPLLGKFSLGGHSIDTATTNQIASGSQTFAGSWAAVSGAVITLTQGQAIAGVTTNAGTRIQCSGGAATSKYSYNAGVGPGAGCAMSMWIYNQGATTVRLQCPFGTGTVNVDVSPGQIRWCQAATHLMGASARQIRIATVNVGDAFDIIAFQPQIEDNPVPTAFASASRAEGVLDVRTPCTAEEGTVAGWYTPFRVVAAITATTNSPSIFTLGGYFAASSFRLWAHHASGAEPQLRLFVRGSTNAGWSLQQVVRASGTGWYVPGTPVHLAVVWTTGNSFTVYVNGVAFGPYAIADAMSSANTSFDTLGIGTPNASAAGDGHYCDVVAAPFAMSASQIAALAARTAVLPGAPYIEASGDAFRGRSVSVLGEVTDGGNLVALADGSAREKVGFRLGEV